MATAVSRPLPVDTARLDTGSGGGRPLWSQPVFAGGWNDFATEPGTPQYELAKLLSGGTTGQAAVDILNQNTSTRGISYYPDKNLYGLPNGYYIAPNPSNPSALDLISRGGGETSTTGVKPNPSGASSGPAEQNPYGTVLGVNPYPAAFAAALRQRRSAGLLGRQSTILAGFNGGSPATAPATLLGRS